MNRREFMTLGAAGLALSATARAQDGKDVSWYDVTTWGVEGKGWKDTARYFDRLPARAEKSVRKPVWSLSRHSAGMLVRFKTDSPRIHARYALSSPRLAMPHMPATGVSGLDLYGRDEKGRDRWVAVVKPSAQKIETALVSNVDPRPGGEPRRYTVYLPLYNGVESLEIGVEDGRSFTPVAPRKDKPLVFYGTSIMHGACASRPGMSITGILGRRLDRPVINLGFSGNGRMDPEVGELLAELDPAVYAIDCLPNMQGAQVAERTGPLVRTIRKARPDTPILLVEDRSFTSAPFLKGLRERHRVCREALRKAYGELRDAGVGNLHYLEGDVLLGGDGEAATDGSHPSDLGMVRYADAYEPVLRKALG